MSEPLTQTDPFTQAYRKLWAQLESEDLFKKLVPKGNRIKYDGADRSPEKDQTSTADFPEVRIVASSGETDLVRSSKDTTVTQVFQIQMASGDQRFTVVFLPLKWACIRALTNTKDNPENFGLPFVTDVRVLSSTDFDADIEGRARQQWAGVIDVEIDFTFNTASETQTR